MNYELIGEKFVSKEIFTEKIARNFTNFGNRSQYITYLKVKTQCA